MSRINKGMSVRSFQARVQHWCQQAGLTVHATPHWMRHTMAQRILARSTAADPIGIVQSALGHKSRSSTGIYTKPTREAVSHAMELAS
jgi:site-specific recombinase XerD